VRHANHNAYFVKDISSIGDEGWPSIIWRRAEVLATSWAGALLWKS
jgi:hypothetical protein